MYVKGWTAKEEYRLYQLVKRELSGKKMSLRQAVRNIHWWMPDRSIDSLYGKAKEVIKYHDRPKKEIKTWEDIEEGLYKDVIDYMEKYTVGDSEACLNIARKYEGRDHNQLVKRFREIRYSNIENTSKKKLERYTAIKWKYGLGPDFGAEI